MSDAATGRPAAIACAAARPKVSALRDGISRASHLAQQYDGTRKLADDIALYIPPAGSVHPRPEGLRAPSVRTPRRSAHQPSQFALFVMNAALQEPFEQRGSLVEQWRLTFEFQEPSPGMPSATIVPGSTGVSRASGWAGHPRRWSPLLRPDRTRGPTNPGAGIGWPSATDE